MVTAILALLVMVMQDVNQAIFVHQIQPILAILMPTAKQLLLDHTPVR